MRESPVVRSAERSSLRRFALPGTGLAAVALVLVLVLSIASPLASGFAGSSSGARPASAASAGEAAPAATPPCYNINQTICVAMQNTTEPNIIPAPGSHVTAVEPPSSTTLTMYVESTYPLPWPTARYEGTFSPISLNLSGTLWNGVSYYNQSDNSIWHPPGTAWWGYGPTGQNATYPYWYGVNMSARTASGPQFFPGMHIDWWLYITSNVSGVLHHFSSVTFQFTYSGAFPASPYPGAYQYGGASAALEDVAVAQSPLVPNFNDSITVNISTTGADLLSGATLGGGYLDFNEYAPDGAVIVQTAWSFPVKLVGALGQLSSNITVPAAYAQVPGALVEYNLTVWDTNPYGPDQVITPVYSYTVNGNGSFGSGGFANNLALTATPAAALVGGTPPPQVHEGTPVTVLLTSRNPASSILTAELRYSFDYPGISENASEQVAMVRLNSTNFFGTIPAMPLNATVTFSVTAWDFGQDQESSQDYTYATPSLAGAMATVPTNSTFFLAYVYDAGHHAWVTGASVAVAGDAGFVHVTGTTFLGVDYPNATGTPFVPLFLPAGETYRIYVNDTGFRPPGSQVAEPVSVVLRAPHALTADGILAVGSNYEVAEAGSAIFFWLNETGPGTAFSPGSGGIGAATILAAGIGLGAMALVAIPTVLWWRSIRARRLAEERRITL
jgi:hypothetical protein